MIDLHNFKIEGELKKVNPKLSFRNLHSETSQQNMMQYENFFLEEPKSVSKPLTVPSTIDDLNETMQNLKVRERDQFILNNMTECEICNQTYGTKGPLKNHLVKKHGVDESLIYFLCEQCAKPFPDQKKFTRHLISHEIR